MTSSLLLELTSVCITTVSSAKTDEPIKTSFAWGVDPWPKEPRIRSGCGYRVQIRGGHTRLRSTGSSWGAYRITAVDFMSVFFVYCAASA